MPLGSRKPPELAEGGSLGHSQGLHGSGRSPHVSNERAVGRRASIALAGHPWRSPRRGSEPAQGPWSDRAAHAIGTIRSRLDQSRRGTETCARALPDQDHFGSLEKREDPKIEKDHDLGSLEGSLDLEDQKKRKRNDPSRLIRDDQAYDPKRSVHDQRDDHDRSSLV